jgi:hypothetical protein
MALNASATQTPMPHGAPLGGLTRRGGGFYGYRLHAAVCTAPDLPVRGRSRPRRHTKPGSSLRCLIPPSGGVRWLRRRRSTGLRHPAHLYRVHGARERSPLAGDTFQWTRANVDSLSGQRQAFRWPFRQTLLEVRSPHHSPSALNCLVWTTEKPAIRSAGAATAVGPAVAVLPRVWAHPPAARRPARWRARPTGTSRRRCRLRPPAPR